MAAFPAAFFIACGRPNLERSPLPLLTVLPLLIGEQQEEGEEVKNERDGTSGVSTLQGSFFVLLPLEEIGLDSTSLFEFFQ